MEKNLKIVRTIAVLSVVVLLCVISFIGINARLLGVWVNKVKDYKYGMEFDGYREFRFTLDESKEEKDVYVDDNGNVIGDPNDGSETTLASTNVVETETTDGDLKLPVADDTKTDTSKDDAVNKARQEVGYALEKREIKANEDDAINKENFDKTKRIIQERLETISNYEYNIRIDDITGDMVVELPENDNIELEQSLILTKGLVEVIDTQTGVVLLDNSDFVHVDAIASELEDLSGVQVYMNIQLNEEGTKILKKMSNDYTQTVDGAGVETIKYVTVRLDGQNLISTYFGEEIINGELNIPMGEPATDEATYNNIYEQLTRLISIINGERLPLTYILHQDTFVNSSITDDMINVAKVLFAVAVVVASVIMVVKYKVKGLVLAILSLGFVALTDLTVRYMQITVTINSVIAALAIIIMNYAYMFKVLAGYKDNTITKVVYKEVSKHYYLSIAPVIILAIIFTFMNGAVINSIGVVLFWGLLVQALYNALTIRVFNVI